MPIGYKDEFKPYETNMIKWYKDSNKWVVNNQDGIKTDIINTITSKLYS